MKTKSLLVLTFLFFSFYAYGQQIPLDSLSRKERIKIDPLTPSKAAFYSTVVPGLGQIYTRKYWKLPIIYGGLGVAGYFYFYQTNEMNKFRTAYKQRIRGDFSDEYTTKIIANEQLIKGMEFHKQYRDQAVLWFVGLYVLNIIDANVTAHLLQFNVDDTLTFKPFVQPNLLGEKPNVGLAFQIKL